MQFLSGSDRFNSQAAETSAPFVGGVCDVFEKSDNHDAPGHRRPLVIFVDLETDGGAWTVLELGPWFSSEHNRFFGGCIVHGKDPWSVIDDNRETAQIVGPQKRPAVLVGEGLYVPRSWHKAGPTEPREPVLPSHPSATVRSLGRLVTP